MNPLKPEKAVITKVREEAEAVKTYTLSVRGVSSFDAGRLSAGQFNMLGFPGAGEAPISLSSLPRDGLIEHTIKAVGRVTEHLSRFKSGDFVYLRGPYGRGWPLESAAGGDLVLIAGGIGLAPIRPVVHQVLENRGSFGKVSVLIGARNEKNMPFTDEFEAWEKGVSLYATVDEVSRGASWGYRKGLITELLGEIEISPERTAAFICGPEIMMRFLCRGLILRGIDPRALFVSLERRMKCGVAQCGHCQHGGFFVCRDGPVFPYADVRGLPDGLL